MYGRTPRGDSYYVCAPKPGYTAEGHPGNMAIWVREKALVAGVNAFLAERVFGQYRADLLATHLKMADSVERHDRERQIAALRKAISDSEVKSKRLIRNLEMTDEPDQDMIRDINERRAELRAERDDLRQWLEALEEQAVQASNPDLLYSLPVGPVDLDTLPDELSRRLFEALRLEIQYNRRTNIARCRITLVGETIPAAHRASADAVGSPAAGKIERGECSYDHKTRSNDHATFCTVPPTGFATDPCRTDQRFGVRAACRRGQF
ncbi:hypothetical protein FDG2_2503 [Candidatus Protofrankia californiensis]|uniref:Recombinase n=1 Tax=Candidatus Protofrankia californiensis TaxID=1839754 RepID=A0A1C3NXR4_9ACTN|nr:hypothetical protein FDG2_2503 [Candidatus Protofrankia californiensis]